MTPLRQFLERAFAFSTTWAEAAANADDGKLSESKSLQLGTSLYSDLMKIAFPDPSDSSGSGPKDENGIGKLTQEACERLCQQLDTLGMKWLKDMANDNSSDSSKPLSDIAAGTIVSPTPRLKDAIATCRLIPQISKIQSTSKELQGGESTFSSLGDVLSLYVMASSMDAGLMEAISPSSIEACTSFQKCVDQTFRDLCATFLQNADQFKILAEKYEQLSFILEIIDKFVFCGDIGSKQQQHYTDNNKRSKKRRIKSTPTPPLINEACQEGRSRLANGACHVDVCQPRRRGLRC